jgi:hypothetical protein
VRVEDRTSTAGPPEAQDIAMSLRWACTVAPSVTTASAGGPARRSSTTQVLTDVTAVLVSCRCPGSGGAGGAPGCDGPAAP